MSDYIVFDFETTSVYTDTTEIIEISAIKIENDAIVDTFNTLVHPTAPIPKEASAVNHITDEMVADAPPISDVLPKFLEFIGNTTLLGHNISGFDLPILRRYASNIGWEITNEYIDTLPMSRRRVDIKSHRLTALAEYYGIDCSGAHRALADCITTYEVYKRIRELPDTIIPKSHHEHSMEELLTAETKALQSLTALLETVVSDGVLTDEEIHQIASWLADNSEYASKYPFNKLNDFVSSALSDGVVTDQERADLFELFNIILNPVENSAKNAPVISSLADKHFCLTGEFTTGTKSAIASTITSKGAIEDKGVTKKTDILIVGGNGNSNWICGNYGSKVKKALELQEKGSSIIIISEVDFFEAIKNI